MSMFVRRDGERMATLFQANIFSPFIWLSFSSVWTIFSIHPMTDWTQREREREINQTMPLTDQSTVYKRVPFPHISSSSTINRTQSKLNFFSFFFMGGMSWVGLSFYWVDSNHIPFPFPQTFSSSQLGDVVVPPNTEKLCLLKDEKKSVKVFSAIHVCGHGLAASPMGIIPFLPSQQDQSFSVRARANSPFTSCFSFSSVYFFFSSRNNFHYNFFFMRARLFRSSCRLGWFAGSERCAISTACS